MLLLYIDPGTGSMLFSIIIGLVTMLYFVAKAALIKVKFFLTGGKAVASNKNRYPFVIYSESERYWSVFKPILDAFEKRQISVMYFTSAEKDPFFSNPYSYINGEFIGEGNKAFTRLNFLEADICLMTTPGLDVYQLKRSRGVKHYAHVLHSVADATSYRLFGLDYFDSVFLSGTYQEAHIRILEEQRGIAKKELVVVGCTYLDMLNQQLSTFEPDENHLFTVLVAPSWGSNGILSKYGERLLDPLVETGFQIIVRPHPQSIQSEKAVLERLQRRYASSSNLEWNYSRENIGTLFRSDIMISDFSGVIFDYSFLLDRPFLYVNANFDDRPYDGGSIDEEPWKFKILPEIGVELIESSFPTIKEVLLDTVQNETLTKNRLQAKETAWQFRGHSGEKIVDYLAAKQKELGL
ncbi:glycosyl/glycerophosphate transferase, teichoic acid biosynthesis [Sphaerochaeta pleomorpha str. Grapes]|uniref:Glycosyl/glycerophosphate transferase, teichoic acid biosynthesis n=1 Tax=Sphaerochaeta pleomorpha (strain ATCC BAA-1885 / DSM 22778 / Grapes) TaxID=158190 RepID=G8QVS7_SPHPG|nr:CDP-glycerol glycerophosphotransferase family protein [Sphaerochaeta pleomorpha]AEV29369.1 glycosyl/glycerophosphate transferase, teichoic acid biosynthesis [Sphaerochaeta pleomorpha str. Grapes]